MADLLLPAVVQDAITGRVLMVGYVNGEALRRTDETGLVHFWSRSRARLWQKGETSGNVLRLVEKYLDCDQDTWLIRAIPSGPTCHTGELTCFGNGGSEPPPHELAALEQTILARIASAGRASYVRSLVAEGNAEKIAAKIVEEADELVQELKRTDGAREPVIREAADLLFHTLVGLAARGISLAEVEQELHRRQGLSGLEEKQRRGSDPK